MAKTTETIKGAQEFIRKAKGAGVKIKQLKAKKYNPGKEGARNANQSYTAGGRQSQAYNKDTKEFEKTASSTKAGLMSVEGSNNTKGAKTWTMTEKDDNGNTVRQSGRSQVASRGQREYDVKKGLNNISQKVIDAWLENGMARLVDGRLVGNGGNVITRNANGSYSMGLSMG